MNELLEMLTGGNLQSDGRANKVADRVVAHPHLLDQLVQGLSEADDVIHARTAHALERISRTHPELVISLLPRLMELALDDAVPMVRWHMAMIFANLPLPSGTVNAVLSTLFQMLEDTSVFVKSWAIVALTILGRKHRMKCKKIAAQLRRLQNDRSVAIRSKVIKALKVLGSDDEPIPAGWVKAEGFFKSPRAGKRRSRPSTIDTPYLKQQ
jgi:HEAT repeat protein